MTVRQSPVLSTILATLLLLVPACGGDAPPPEASARPVVTVVLESRTPRPPLRVTGVAEPYREADVSFEVSGRITAIFDVGRTVEVRSREKSQAELGEEKNRWIETGRPLEDWKPEPLVHTGDVIATMDPTSYRQRKDGALLKLRTAESRRAAQVLDLEQVVPAMIARATAQRNAAEKEIASARASVASAESNKNTAASDLERNKKLLRDRQISPAEFDQYRNAHETAVANLAKAEAGFEAAEQLLAAYEASVAEARAAKLLKEAEVAQTDAQIAELSLGVEQADTDLQRCQLRTPFVGRITHVFASQGDYVAAGTPVLRLTLIDPIRVSVTVSAERERLITPGNHVKVQPKGLEEGKELFGTVFEKGAVADAATRTFRIDVMVRNARLRLADTGQSGAAKIRFRELLPAVERHHGEGGPLYVCWDCRVREGDKHVLYRVKGGKFGQWRPRGLFLQRLELERVEVVPVSGGPEKFMQILNWSFRHVEPAAGFTLHNGDLLINFKHLDPKAVKRGLFLEHFEWAIRPGDLVPIVLDVGQKPAGYWVPGDAIRARNDRRSVFAVEGGKAREVPVSVHESCEGMHRIEGEGLKPGMKLVVVGAHYLFDGADVVVTREEDLDAFAGCGR